MQCSVNVTGSFSHTVETWNAVCLNDFESVFMSVKHTENSVQLTQSQVWCRVTVITFVLQLYAVNCFYEVREKTL